MTLHPNLQRARTRGPWPMLLVLTIPTLAGAQLPPPPVSPAPVVKLEYDAHGNFRRSIQAPSVADIATSHEHDRLHRRFKTTDARGKPTLLDYNGREDVVRLTDPRNLVTQYPRNGLGDSTGLVSPDTGAAIETRDAAGNLATRLDSRGVLASYVYDALNRRTSVTYSQSGQPAQAFTWSYDETGPGFSHGVGRLTSTQYPGGGTSFAYDARGRLIRSTQRHAELSVSLTTGYGLDAAGRTVSIGYPSGRVLYIEHSGGVPSSLSLAPDASAAALPLLSEIRLEPAPGGEGPARSWLWHNDSGTVAHERSFDGSGRMTRYPLGGAIRDLSYDATDRIMAYTHLDGASGTATAASSALNQGFGYDEVGRLTSVTTSLGLWAYGYDDNGNRSLLQHSTTAGTVLRHHTIDAGSNRLLAIDNPTRTFGHDMAGNVVSDKQFGGVFSRTFDLQGRLNRVRGSTDGRYFTTTVFEYNAAGQRVLKHPQVIEQCRSGPLGVCSPAAYPNPVLFVHDTQGRLMGEYDGYSGRPLREYVWLQGMPVAVVDGPTASPSITYLHTDHIDTPRVAVDRRGRQRWSWVAEPFGHSAPVTNPVGAGEFVLNLRMPGQYFDVETGLAQNWHREYDAGVGRYAQSDPIGLGGGINTYAYVDSNPLSYTDPMGLDRWGDQPGFRWGTKLGVPLPDGGNSRLYVFSTCVQACYGDPLIITSTNEPYKGHGPGTAHGDSAAIDLRYSAMSNPDKALCCAAQCGARYGLDEMKNPSEHSSAPHFHLELPHPRNKKWSRGNLPAGECSKC